MYTRKHSEDNVTKFKNCLSRVNWNEILDGNDANSDYDNFVNRFKELYDECIPLKRSRTNRKKTPQSPWITKGLLKSINVKNKLYKQYLLRPTEENSVKFKSYRNKLNNLIRKCKREYFYKKFESTKNNIRQTWKTINGIIGRGKSKSQQSTFKTDDGGVVTEPEIISNSFNNFFVDIGPKLASQIQHSGKDYYEYLQNPTQSCLFMKPIIAEEIVKIISTFNQNKSPGHDNIGILVILL